MTNLRAEPAEALPLDSGYVLNHCTKFLARDNADPRHNYGHLASDDPRGRIGEPWRFPIIDSYSDGVDPVACYGLNRVTFVYPAAGSSGSRQVSVVGTFCNLYSPMPLTRVRFRGEETRYFAVSVVVPKGDLHFYKFFVDGQPVLDPVNPQQDALDNGETWSRFFTQLCTQRICFEKWEMEMLDRMTAHVLPFRTAEGERFLNHYYNYLDKQSKQAQYPRVYRFDESVGVTNYIDKQVARDESHHLIDYKICLRLIRDILRTRHPTEEPGTVPREFYATLYEQMGASGGPGENPIAGWDYSRYGSPRYFLQLLRRHTFTGAFSHPKHGGNAGGAGWAYLSERYRDKNGKSLFSWRQAIEPPLGSAAEYHG
jgi:hypothetical protein